MNANQLAIVNGRCEFAMDTEDGVVSKSGATLWCNRRQVLQDSLLGGEDFCVKPGLFWQVGSLV